MDIKDCEIGTRVICTNPDYNNVIPVGAVGTIMDNYTTIPWVSFDDKYSEKQHTIDGHPNCKVMSIDETEVLKENTSKETNIGKLSVSVSLEDKQEIAKDVLKIVLNDFNKAITNATTQLCDDSEDEVVEIKEANNVLELFTDQNMSEIVEQALKEAFKETFLNSLNK